MPDRHAEAARAQRAAVARPRGVLQLGERTVRLTEPQIMGILNVTPDIFSDGGKPVDAAAASDEGFAMASAGAAIVHVCGESNRPGQPLVWEGYDIQSVRRVLAAMAKGAVPVAHVHRQVAGMTDGHTT